MQGFLLASPRAGVRLPPYPGLEHRTAKQLGCRGRDPKSRWIMMDLVSSQPTVGQSVCTLGQVTPQVCLSSRKRMKEKLASCATWGPHEVIQ